MSKNRLLGLSFGAVFTLGLALPFTESAAAGEGSAIMGMAEQVENNEERIAALEKAIQRLKEGESSAAGENPSWAYSEVCGDIPEDQAYVVECACVRFKSLAPKGYKAEEQGAVLGCGAHYIEAKVNASRTCSSVDPFSIIVAEHGCIILLKPSP